MNLGITLLLAQVSKACSKHDILANIRTLSSFDIVFLKSLTLEYILLKI